MNNIQFGNILFYSGNSIFSKVVKWITNSQFSHCSIVIDKYHIVEISWNYKLKIRHLHYKDNEFVIKRYINELSEEQKQLMYEFIIDKLNTEYDIIQTVGYLFKKIFGVKVINDRELYNCSEFVDVCYKSIGIDLLENDFESTVSPGELFKSEILVKIS